MYKFHLESCELRETEAKIMRKYVEALLRTPEGKQLLKKGLRGFLRGMDELGMEVPEYMRAQLADRIASIPEFQENLMSSILSSKPYPAGGWSEQLKSVYMDFEGKLVEDLFRLRGITVEVLHGLADVRKGRERIERERAGVGGWPRAREYSLDEVSRFFSKSPRLGTYRRARRVEGEAERRRPPPLLRTWFGRATEEDMDRAMRSKSEVASLRILEEYLPEPEEPIIDIGCGPISPVVRRYGRKKRITCVDDKQEFLDSLRKRFKDYKLRTVNVDARFLSSSFGRDEFRTAISLNVFSSPWMDRIDKISALLNMLYVTDGEFLLTVPTLEDFYEDKMILEAIAKAIGEYLRLRAEAAYVEFAYEGREGKPTKSIARSFVLTGRAIEIPSDVLDFWERAVRLKDGSIGLDAEGATELVERMRHNQQVKVVPRERRKELIEAIGRDFLDIPSETELKKLTEAIDKKLLLPGDSSWAERGGLEAIHNLWEKKKVKWCLPDILLKHLNFEPVSYFDKWGFEVKSKRFVWYPSDLLDFCYSYLEKRTIVI